MGKKIQLVTMNDMNAIQKSIQSVNDSKFVTKEYLKDIEDKLEGKLDIDDSILSDKYYTKTEILANYYDMHAIRNMLLEKLDKSDAGKINPDNFYTKKIMDEKLSKKFDKISAGSIDNSNFYTKGEIDTKFYNRSSIDSAINRINLNKLDISVMQEIDNKLSQKLDKSNATAIDNSNYYTKHDTEIKISESISRLKLGLSEDAINARLEHYCTNSYIDGLMNGINLKFEKFASIDNSNYYMKSQVFNKMEINKLLEERVHNNQLAELNMKIDSKFDKADAGTIDNTNFYTKQEVYNKPEIEGFLSTKLNNTEFENMVSTLNDRINEKLDASDAGTIDNTNFYTKQEVYNKPEIEGFLRKTLKDTDLNEINRRLDEKMDQSAVVNIENFYNKNEINTLLQSKFSIENYEARMENYYDKSAIDKKLENFSSNSYTIDGTKYTSKIEVVSDIPYIVLTKESIEV